MGCHCPDGGHQHVHQRQRGCRGLAVGRPHHIQPVTHAFDLARRQHPQVAQEALKKPQLIAQYQRMGAEPVGSSPQEFAAYMKSEEKKWAEIVRLSGAKAD